MPYMISRYQADTVGHGRYQLLAILNSNVFVSKSGWIDTVLVRVGSKTS